MKKDVLKIKTFLAGLMIAGAAQAEPLAGMEGSWRGAGWARETLQGPQETVRCQIRNDFDVESLTLKLTGKCVVPGRRLTLSGSLIGSEDSEKMTGRWSNPDGLGSVRINGIRRDDIAAFTFTAKDPATGRDVAQNVEWRISGDTLHLRSTDRSNPDVMMSDIKFSR